MERVGWRWRRREDRQAEDEARRRPGLTHCARALELRRRVGAAGAFLAVFAHIDSAGCELNFTGMLALTAPTLVAGSAPSEGLPLGFPAELWAEMSEEHRSACTHADALLAAFGDKRTASLKSVSRRAGLDLGDALCVPAVDKVLGGRGRSATGVRPACECRNQDRLAQFGLLSNT